MTFATKTWNEPADDITAILTGCGKKARELPVRHPIRGTVTYNGQPIEGATVTFWSVPVATDNWRAVRPIAVVEADGSFAPNSYAEQDGAEAGQYALTIIYRASRASPDLFGGRYSNPNQPIATVNILPGENVLPAIELKGPPLVLGPDKANPGL
jgi:hypothetical protein